MGRVGETIVEKPSGTGMEVESEDVYSLEGVMVRRI